VSTGRPSATAGRLGSPRERLMRNEEAGLRGVNPAERGEAIARLARLSPGGESSPEVGDENSGSCPAAWCRSGVVEQRWLLGQAKASRRRRDRIRVDSLSCQCRQNATQMCRLTSPHFVTVQSRPYPRGGSMSARSDRSMPAFRSMPDDSASSAVAAQLSPKAQPGRERTIGRGTTK